MGWDYVDQACSLEQRISPYISIWASHYLDVVPWQHPGSAIPPGAKAELVANRVAPPSTPAQLRLFGQRPQSGPTGQPLAAIPSWWWG